MIEEDVEQVAEAAAETERVSGACACARAPHGFGPEHVISPAALRIAQGLIGDGDLLEAGLGLRVPGVGVWVQLTGEPAVGPLELVLRRRARDAQQLVEVLGHRHR